MTKRSRATKKSETANIMAGNAIIGDDVATAQITIVTMMNVYPVTGTFMSEDKWALRYMYARYAPTNTITPMRATRARSGCVFVINAHMKARCPTAKAAIPSLKKTGLSLGSSKTSPKAHKTKAARIIRP